MNNVEKILSLLTAAGLFIFVVLNANDFGNAIKGALGAGSAYVGAIGTVGR